MKKSEILEIKKQIKIDSGCIQKISAFFVTTDKNFVKVSPTSLHSIEDSEMELYAKIFKSVLGGKLGQKLFNLGFPLTAKQNQDLLLNLRNSELDDEVVNNYVQTLVNLYPTQDSYFVLFLYGKYDVPEKDKNDDSTGESNELYRFLISCICPAKMSKVDLSYHAGDTSIKSSGSYYIVPQPSFGFLYPAFNERQTDVNSMLTYSKRLTIDEEPLFSRMLGTEFPMSSEDQIEAFAQLADDVFGGECSFSEMSNIQSDILNRMQENSEPMSKSELKSIFEDNYATEMDSFDENYEQHFGKKEIIPDNIVSPSKTCIKTDTFSITIPSENLQLLTIKEIDGIPSIVLKPNTGRIEMNGVSYPIICS